jgi:hypothetical protein
MPSKNVNNMNINKRTISIIWQAGIIDGDGTVTITKQTGRRALWYRACVCVVNTNKDILYPFKGIWGGKIYNDKKRERKDWRPTYRWVCPTAVIPNFLKSVGQYMRTKSELIILVNKLIEHKAQIKHNILSEDELEYREALYLRSLELNKYYRKKKKREILIT